MSELLGGRVGEVTAAAKVRVLNELRAAGMIHPHSGQDKLALALLDGFALEVVGAVVESLAVAFAPGCGVCEDGYGAAAAAALQPVAAEEPEAEPEPVADAGPVQGDPSAEVIGIGVGPGRDDFPAEPEPEPEPAADPEPVAEAEPVVEDPEPETEPAESEAADGAA